MLLQPFPFFLSVSLPLSRRPTFRHWPLPWVSGHWLTLSLSLELPVDTYQVWPPSALWSESGGERVRYLRCGMAPGDKAGMNERKENKGNKWCRECANQRDSNCVRSLRDSRHLSAFSRRCLTERRNPFSCCWDLRVHTLTWFLECIKCLLFGRDGPKCLMIQWWISQEQSV